jgi:hypothetical protein
MTDNPLRDYANHAPLDLKSLPGIQGDLLAMSIRLQNLLTFPHRVLAFDASQGLSPETLAWLQNEARAAIRKAEK